MNKQTNNLAVDASKIYADRWLSRLTVAILFKKKILQTGFHAVFDIIFKLLTVILVCSIGMSSAILYTLGPSVYSRYILHPDPGTGWSEYIYTR